VLLFDGPEDTLATGSYRCRRRRGDRSHQQPSSVERGVCQRADDCRRADVRAWLSQILRNVHRNDLRGRQAARRRPSDGDLPLGPNNERESGEAALVDVASPDPTARHAARLNELRSALQTAMQTPDEMDHRIVLLYFFDGLSLREIAADGPTSRSADRHWVLVTHPTGGVDRNELFDAIRSRVFRVVHLCAASRCQRAIPPTGRRPVEIRPRLDGNQFVAVRDLLRRHPARHQGRLPDPHIVVPVPPEQFPASLLAQPRLVLGLCPATGQKP
jgi:hypothetical protein